MMEIYQLTAQHLEANDVWRSGSDSSEILRFLLIEQRIGLAGGIAFRTWCGVSSGFRSNRETLASARRGVHRETVSLSDLVECRRTTHVPLLNPEWVRVDGLAS
jgi:hypothetical protein